MDPINPKELQKEIGEWAQETFPDQSPVSIVAHLFREAVQLGLSLGMSSVEMERNIHRQWAKWIAEGRPRYRAREEAADCAILLLALAHSQRFDLLEWAVIKQTVNLGREWKQADELGVHEHVQGEKVKI